MKNMLNFSNFSTDELMTILNMALKMKKDPDKYSELLKGKKLYTLFEKTSTRTFLSFTSGITELGGTYYNQIWEDSNFVLGEPISELRYVGRNMDIITMSYSLPLKYSVKSVYLFVVAVSRGAKFRSISWLRAAFNSSA